MAPKALMWILWPSFLAAAGISAAVFALVDPLDIAIFGYWKGDRQTIYTGAFFLFWCMSALSSALSLHMVPKTSHSHDLLDETDVTYKLG
ncbi:MAG TPA: hypothetical protein VK062_02460 [Burkholderiaceae bacterium]|nr:hypothetical protein [Burkholderiaceae bacterium]